MASEKEDVGDAKERSVHTRNLTDGDADPNMRMVRQIANLKGVPETKLETLYSSIDDMIRQLYSNPPSPPAQTELTFVYEGFRITLFQDGTAVFQEEPAEPAPNR